MQILQHQAFGFELTARLIELTLTSLYPKQSSSYELQESFKALGGSGDADSRHNNDIAEGLN